MLCEGFAKLVKQIRGTENIFGYRSTAANQLYLLYCICGKIYFSDKIRPFIKYCWFVINLGAVLVTYTTGLACILYDTRMDARKLLDIATWMGVSASTSISLPSIVYYYRHGIETTIREIDHFCSSRIKISKSAGTFVKTNIDLAGLIISNFWTAFLLIIVHSFVCILDVVLFYKEEKVRDFKYYAFPLPNTEQNGSGKLFAFNCLLVVFNSPLYWFTWIARVTLMTMWGAACHNELMYLRDGIDSRMNGLNFTLRSGYNVSQTWSKNFTLMLIRDIKAFNMINRTIDNFKGFVQFASSLAIPVNFVTQIAQIFTVIAIGMPPAVRMKVFSFFIIAMWPMFLLYWIGEILENAVSAVSFSVYSSPWYPSIQVRKNVHIFLCQTQRSENLSMWKVYPLVMRNFSRLVHSVQATVNLLRKIT